MNKLLLVLIFFAIFSSTALANTGVGFVLGQPTGLSARHDLNAASAIDAAAAWNSGDDKYFLLHADYLWVRANAIKDKNFRADFYFGAGGILSLPENDVGFAVRVPAGISKKFSNPNLEVFAELAIAFLLMPKTDFDLVGGVGLRWWF